MLHSILIIAPAGEARLEKVQELSRDFLKGAATNHPDFIYVSGENSISIEQIRALKKSLSLKPYSAPYKVALIDGAEKLTLQAQQSLLKTLEEPPAHSIILLTCPSKESLLPTILSRCQIMNLSGVSLIKLSEVEMNEQLTISREIISSSPGRRLLISEKYSSDREVALNFLHQQLYFWREALLNGPKAKNLYFTNLKPKQIVRITKLILRALNLLKGNVNHRLVLDNLLLSYPK